MLSAKLAYQLPWSSRLDPSTGKRGPRHEWQPEWLENGSGLCLQPVPQGHGGSLRAWPFSLGPPLPVAGSLSATKPNEFALRKLPTVWPAALASKFAIGRWTPTYMRLADGCPHRPVLPRSPNPGCDMEKRKRGKDRVYRWPEAIGNTCLPATAATRRACAVTALVGMAAAVIMGFFFGMLLASVHTHAAISRAQERMQRIVRLRESEVRRLTAELDFLRRGPGPGTTNPYLGPSGS